MIWGWAALASPHLAPAGSPYPKTQNSLHADAAIQCRDAFFRENLVTQQIFGRALAHFFGYGPKGITMEDLRRPLWPKMVELLMADDGITKLAKIPMKNAVSCSHIFQYIYIYFPISLIWLMGPKETPCATLPWGLAPTSPVLRLFLWPQRHRQFCISQKSCVHLHKTSASKGTNWNTLTVSFHKFTRIEWKCRWKCLDLRAFQASHGNLCPSAAFHPPTFLSRQRMDTPNRWQSRVQLAEINPQGHPMISPSCTRQSFLQISYI